MQTAPRWKWELRRAATLGDLNALELLFSNPEVDIDCDLTGYRWTALHVACFNQRNEAVEAILQRGANPNMRTNMLETPLHICCRKTACVDAAIQSLVKYKANVTFTTRMDRRTPLHEACISGYAFAATFLASHGADVHKKDKHRATPLQLCMENKFDQLHKFLVSLTRNQKPPPDDTDAEERAARAERDAEALFPLLAASHREAKPKKTKGKTKPDDPAPSLLKKAVVKVINAPHIKLKRDYDRFKIGWRSTQCVYSYDFDDKGIVYHLATRGGKVAWKNPSLTGVVQVLRSSMAAGSPSDIVIPGRRTEANGLRPCCTNRLENSWYSLDFGKNHRVRANKYTLRHGHPGVDFCLRYWVVEVSEKGCMCMKMKKGAQVCCDKWTIVRNHQGDVSLRAAAWSVFTWDLHDCPPFRYMRIRQWGPNSSGKHNMWLAGFEVYGELLTFVHPAHRFGS